MAPQKQPRLLASPRFWIASVSLVAVLTMGIVDMDRVAPGPLSRVHAQAFEAEGIPADDCSACHGGWFESLAGACLECHAAIEADLDADSGLHGNLPAGVDRDACGSCHGEHNGPGFDLAGPRSFKLAGAGSREDFDHARLGFELGGAHLELDCSECHAQADADPLPLGSPRFGGLEADCASCHADEHAPVFPRDCTTCHDQGSWETRHFDAHASFFPRLGAHAEAACRACHAADSSAALELRLGRKGGGLPAVRDCSACHDSPHAAPFTAATGGDCAACHEVSHGGFETADERLEASVHAEAGFDLDAPHDQLDCAACHADALAGAPFAERFPGRARTDCAACHDDPHGGQFEPQSACIDCHAKVAFEPHEFDAVRHSQLDLTLTGGHQLQDCGACHLPDAELPDEARRFRGTASACVACHTDAHDGFGFQVSAAGDCAACHDDVAFDHAASGFAHQAETGFALAGAHGQEDCQSCHLSAPEPDASGRQFGRVAALLAARQPEHVPDGSCMDCHSDVHAGVFGEQGDCASCHSTLSFRTPVEAFDHGAATGFALSGKHAGLDCTACHADDPSAPRGRRAAPGADCAACHLDGHGGQFEESPRGADCARCHSPVSSFGEPLFNHDLDSDFALEGRHREIGCADCHGIEPIGGFQLRRYWPLESDCTACHGVVEGGRLRKSRGRAMDGSEGGTSGL